MMFLKHLTVFFFGLVSVLTATVVTAGPTSTSSVQVTFRGKKYDIPDITDETTVSDLQQKIEQVSGASDSQQGRVLFQGQRLEPSDVLKKVGVVDGSLLNLVPSSTSGSLSKKKKSKSSSAKASSSSQLSGSPSSSEFMKDMMAKSGLDPGKLDEVMQSMGGGAGGEGGTPSLQESMEMMSGMMNSPVFQEYMNDPEQLEKSRQMILNNPMLKSMMGSMPGMEDILNDPDAWREAMQAAADLYKNMDPNDLMQAMMGNSDAASNFGGGGGGMPGMFDGTMDSSSSTLAGLDELSEGDD